MIYDLRDRLSLLHGASLRERLQEAAGTLPPVGLVAFGGVPFRGSPPTYMGQEATYEFLQAQVAEALGFSALLTYLNPQRRGLEDLARLLVERDHDWGLYVPQVSVCFAGCPLFVELSFARDRRFHLLWVDNMLGVDALRGEGAGDRLHARVFIATASIKEWRRYLRNRSNDDFKHVHRSWLSHAYEVIAPIYPEYFTGGL